MQDTDSRKHQHVTSQINVIHTNIRKFESSLDNITNNISHSESESTIQIQLRNKSKRNTVHSGYVRRKIKRKWASRFGPPAFLVVLACLAVKFELVIGALTHNLNSVNYYYENSSYTIANDDIERDTLPFLVGPSYNDTEFISTKIPSSGRPAAIYLNEFAVYIPDGIQKANTIAAKHGFTNTGQVSQYLFIVLTYKA